MTILVSTKTAFIKMCLKSLCESEMKKKTCYTHGGTISLIGGPVMIGWVKTEEKKTSTSGPIGLTSACILSSFLRGHGETNTQ